MACRVAVRCPGTPDPHGTARETRVTQSLPAQRESAYSGQFALDDVPHRTLAETGDTEAAGTVAVGIGVGSAEAELDIGARVDIEVAFDREAEQTGSVARCCRTRDSAEIYNKSYKKYLTLSDDLIISFILLFFEKLRN